MNRMNIEERLAAVTRTLEFIAQNQGTREANFERLEQSQAKHDARLEDLEILVQDLAKGQAKYQSMQEFLTRNLASHNANLDRLFELQGRSEHTMAQLMESINSLARIAHAHEQRLSDLEDTQ